MMQGNRRRGLVGRMRVSGDPEKAAAFERLFF
jgi:hypothetical protein